MGDKMMELIIKIAFFVGLGVFIYGWWLLIRDEQKEYEEKKKNKKR
jgi:hypothetical protein